MRLTVLLLAASGFAADWPSFRGPNGSGVSHATNLPTEFGPKQNVVWRAPLPPGASSPVLTEDAIFLTAAENSQLITLKLNRANGQILWRRALPQTRVEKRHQLNNPASPSPVTDGKNVYVFFSDFGLISYAPDGNERWRLPLPPFANFHGMGASPVLAGNKLILVCDQDLESFVLAIDKNTGKQLWKTARPSVVHGFATPSLFRTPNGDQQVIVPGSYLLAAYGLEDGKERWTVRGLSWQIKATAVVDNDTIYATGWAPGADPGQAKPLPPFEEAIQQADANKDGKLANDELPPPFKHGGSWSAIDLNNDGVLAGREWGFYRGRREANNVTLAVKPGNARGDLTATHVTWKSLRMVPEVPSPLFLNGVLYTIKTGGILTAIDAATGELKKSARVTGAIDSYYASPIAADGKLFLFSEQGKAAVLKPGAEWELLKVNDFEEPIYATPAVAAGRLYIRTTSALFAIGEKRGSSLPELPPKIAARLNLGRAVAAEIPASSQENRAWIHVSPIIDPLKGMLEDRGPGVEPHLVSHGTENAVIGYSVRRRELNRKYEEAPDDWDLIGLAVDEVYLVVTDDELTELLAKWMPDLNALGLPHDVGDPF